MNTRGRRLRRASIGEKAARELTMAQWREAGARGDMAPDQRRIEADLGAGDFRGMIVALGEVPSR